MKICKIVVTDRTHLQSFSVLVTVFWMPHVERGYRRSNAQLSDVNSGSICLQMGMRNQVNAQPNQTLIHTQLPR